MDPATVLALVNVGVKVADLTLKALERSETEKQAHNQELSTLIGSTSERLGRAISDSTQAIIEKFEADKLEELHSRIKNLSFLLKAGKEDQALHYAMTLNESVDYAENRIKEQKLEWIGPWMAGLSVVTSSYQICGLSPDIREYGEKIQQARIKLVDYLVRHLVRESIEIPWLQVCNFISGEDDKFLSMIKSNALVNTKQLDDGKLYRVSVLGEYSKNESLLNIVSTASGWDRPIVERYLAAPSKGSFKINLTLGEAREIKNRAKACNAMIEIIECTKK